MVTTMSTATAPSAGPQRTTASPSASPRQRAHSASPATSLSTAAASNSTAATTSTRAQQSQSQSQSLQPSLPSPSTQRHISEARAAVVASISNMLDSSLQSRPALLHANAAALGRQEKDVVRATEALRRERERLAREAARAARGVKELGNVQNWAEVLERGFLVLEETVRLAAEGDSEDESGCSCSECGSGAEEEEEEEEEDRRMDLDDDGGHDQGPPERQSHDAI